MKKIFAKSDFPDAPGGDRYEWRAAETPFSAPEEGIYAIQITASAKGGKQNQSNDDDDLRVALNKKP